MGEVAIRFNKDMMECLKIGKMKATTRKEPLATPGDYFVYKRRRFEITRVYPKQFIDIIQSDFELNGFDTPNEMAMTMTQYYPKITPQTVMYVHEFKEVNA